MALVSVFYEIPDSLKGRRLSSFGGIGFRIPLRGLSGFGVPTGLVVPEISASSFPYNWYSVIYVIKKIHYIINYKGSKCDLYAIDYILQSPIHFSKGLLNCVINCTKFLEQKSQWIYVEEKLFSIWTVIKQIACFNKKKGEIEFTFPIFDKKSYPHQNHWNLAVNIVFFQSNRLNK